MRRGEFEDIFEECLSALLEGRRSIEESLSLYPAWRGRLEPLLRTARETAARLDQTPPPHLKERGLQRFLDAARARRRVRQMLSPYAIGTPWWRWASAGLGAVVVVGALAFASATLMADDGRNLSEAVSVRPYAAARETSPPPEEPQSSLDRVQEGVAELESSIRLGEPVRPALLRELNAANSELAEELEDSETVLVERVAAVSAASRQFELLQGLREESAGLQSRAVTASMDSAEDVLSILGAPTPESSPAATPSPTPAPTATPSPTLPAATAAPHPSP